MRHFLLTLSVLCGLAAPLSLNSPAAYAATAAASTPTARVIVKFKSEAATLRKQAFGVAKPTAAQAAAVHSQRASALGARTGLALAAGLGLDERTQVVTAQGLTSQQLAQHLAQDADVEYAVVDGRRRAMVAPNDPLYASGPPLGGTSGGPPAGQWYLRAPNNLTRSAIDIEGAWAVTAGSPSIVIAVLDSGLRFEHPDLQGGHVLPGYDFISDTFTANDGGGRDADASDPGDWFTTADVSNPGNIYGCTASDVGNSSWHGTETLGLIGAVANNGIGMAGIGRGNVRVMPVRVLGKCGGSDSDIIAGMRWAAGLAVPGVPINPTPARVINMSLGGDGSCLASAYPDAVAAVTAAGAVVVASAGNGNGNAVSLPANCAGVIGVAGLRHVGTKVGYSDLGPEIALSAPAGNCVNGGTNACLYPILTTSNAGPQAPVAGGSIYTDSFNASLGTSFSAPLVSGTVALMLSAQPALTAAEVKQALQATARPFPTSGGGDGTAINACQAGSSTTSKLECYCTTSTCGAGMLDAGAAVRKVANVGLARIVQSPTTAVAGQPLTLSADTSLPPGGRTISGYQWQLTDGGGIVSVFSSSATMPTVTLLPSAAGAFRVAVTVTDSAGGTASTAQTVTVTAAASSSNSSGGGGALGLPWLVLLALAVVAAARLRPQMQLPKTQPPTAGE